MNPPPTTAADTADLLDEIEPLLTLDAEGFEAAVRGDLDRARQALADLKALPADASFETVLRAFDDLGLILERGAQMSHVFFQVHPDAAVRESAAALEQELSRFGTELSLDRGVYDRLAALDPADADGEVEARLLEHALRDYRRAGVDRDEATRQRIRALNEELVKVGQEFQTNIVKDVRSITIPEGAAGLDGLPDDFVASHPPAADGSVTITTDPTDVQPFMTYGTRREHRKALFHQYMNRAVPQNLAVLDRMLALRHELATRLGYPHWAAYATEDKMIKTAEAAGEFIERIIALADERLRREVDEVLAEVRSDFPHETEVRDHDRGHYIERLRRKRCAFDSRDARPYFPYDAVEQGVLDTAARVFGVTFERADVATWHADVRVFEVRRDGRRCARIFLDMHPRKDKYKHACMMDMARGLAGRRLAQGALVCNFPATDAAAGKPGLMEPEQVRTLFHEFGHLMHHVLACEQRWHAVAGIATEWDFVEVPSQLFEEWGRDHGVLSRFAKHHRTGEPIPAELVQRMNAAQDYGKGIATRVQMYYASVSLHFYDRDPAGLDTTRAMLDLRERQLPFPAEPDTAFQASFGHLHGYTALYYTYMWSLVLAKDCLRQFGSDIMDPAVGRRYRQQVLEPGGSRDAADLMQDFLGRAPSMQAFEEWLAR